MSDPIKPSEVATEEIEEFDEPECQICIQDGKHLPNIATRQCAKFASQVDEHVPMRDAPICNSCCEEEFLYDARGCFDNCVDPNAIPENLSSLIEKTFDLQDLDKQSVNRAEVYMNKARTFMIGADLSKPLERLKPSPVNETFEDRQGNGFYVKDHSGTVHNYDYQYYNEVNERLDAIVSSSLQADILCTADGLLFIIWNYNGLQFGAAITPSKQELIEPVTIVKELQEKAIEARKFFGVTPDQLHTGSELSKKLEELTEDQLIDWVVIPLFRKRKFDNVVRVPRHGPGEAGVDVGPMRRINELGFDEFWGVQTKAKKIHATSSKADGNVDEILRQISEAFRTPRLFGNQEVMITNMYVICSTEITPDAATQIKHEAKRGTNVTVVNGHKLAELMIKYDIELPF